MVSLLELAEITEEGVKFKSPHDGSDMMLTPEKSIEIQNAIGMCNETHNINDHCYYLVSIMNIYFISEMCACSILSDHSCTLCKAGL